eukprot:TRINITY_DN9447_c0_g5_i2.p2 TRINITY_DN9447_c0_g5~~TRINITY_DN9447_c0_g5_i2.p2  ORF type:complete len:214 (-),score=40.45 TRINITY_DN9447_c0_g5_i2:267-908(-)
MQEPIEFVAREDSMYSTPEKHLMESNAQLNDPFMAGLRSSSVSDGQEMRKRSPSKRTSLQRAAKRTRKLSKVLHLDKEESPVKETIQFTPCFTCQCYQPPRAHHCRRCGRCILRRDHHCIWLGTCIGYRNYKYFILLLHYQTLFLLFILLESAMQVNELWNKYRIMCILFFALTVPEFFLVVALCLFHTRLLTINMTSLERVKHPNQVKLETS